MKRECIKNMFNDKETPIYYFKHSYILEIRRQIDQVTCNKKNKYLDLNFPTTPIKDHLEMLKNAYKSTIVS